MLAIISVQSTSTPGSDKVRYQSSVGDSHGKFVVEEELEVDV
jgi:hypothetical protein